MNVDATAKNPMGFSRAMENMMVLTLCLVFGFVMFDRFALTNLETYIMLSPAEGGLGITVSQIGMITSAFAIAWAIAGYIGGVIADISRAKKKLLFICVLLFSVLSLSTGFAGGFVSLLLIRLLMGVVEGPVLPLNQTIMINESTPNRRGLNAGLMQTSAVGLVSSLLGPIICVALAEAFGWRATFYITIIPGLIICVMIWFFIKEPVIGGVNVAGEILDGNQTAVSDEEGKAAVEEQKAQLNKDDEKPTFRESLKVIKNRNVIVSILAGIFILYWYLCTLSFTPAFLVNDKGIDPTSMSFIMSCYGIGAIIWGIVIPKLSDIFGRKPLIIIGCFMSILANLGLLLSDNAAIMAVCCIIGWAGAGVFPLFESAVPAESVDPRYSTSAIGLVQLVGELIGSGVGATVCGIIGETYGLAVSQWTCFAAIIIAAIISFGYYETAPAVLAKRASKKA
jgi:MFS family permease